ncbi:MAG: hypothetical protein KKE20_05890 [Nanoarchaeota archaeon]|nr:hypothetical protein [Nanoarchaeota archaeon]
MLRQSYKDMKDHKFIAKTALSDLSFFIAFSLAFTWFFNRVAPLLESINQLVMQMGSSIPLDNSLPDQQAFSSISSHYQEISSMSMTLFSYLMLLAFCTFALWCIFQGTSWWITHQKMKNKVSWCRFQQRFSIVSLIYLFLLMLFVFIIMQVSRVTTFGGVELIEPSMLAYIVLFSWYVLLYFSSFSYAVAHKDLRHIIQSVYNLSIKKAAVTVPVFLFITIKMIAVYYILRIISYLAGFDIFWTVILGCVFFIPLFAWARMFICLVVDKPKK